ncbi:MAG: TetM/TetW/TetO/TetS family tetracycline resistance ribosomal protection protein [Chloroflexota bacterium]|nr:TetM/TetW/TetO/TetS family tetracycline resistance ribosomal protection protein [Chloroflexota bacterium]
MPIINLGILAHVDAGKTSLTERILFETGVIPSVGRVDDGTTQTDTLELERARGITIKSAVVSFRLNDLKVNLIDTPGHPDFVAEVERSLRVLDGVVLVVSAVEGVQSQTRRLAWAVRAAGLPLLLFVNKVDRLGARGEALLDDIRRKLNLRRVAMNAPVGIGERSVTVVARDRDDRAWRDPVIDLLAEADEGVIDAFERAGDLSLAFVEAALRAGVAAGEVVPLFFGSAVTGAGVPDLLAGVEAWLPPADERTDAPVDGTVFKIARRPSGEKIAYARLFAGGLAVRQRVVVRRGGGPDEPKWFEERITGIDRFAEGAVEPVGTAGAGEIVALHGLRAVRIGDRLGDDGRPGEDSFAFPAPVLESVVRPVQPDRALPLRAALEQLAEQDPLISLRQRNDEGEISVRLYGEVQKEVIAETLAREYSIGVSFGPSRTVCIERPVGAGEQLEVMFEDGNPFAATIGFRIEPAELGSGVRYERELGSLPLAFYRAIEETLHETLGQGLRGWAVTDCVVTLTEAGFSAPVSVAADFRKLTPLVLMEALSLAGTEVCEPVDAVDLEVPEDTFGPVCGALTSARGTIRDVVPDETTCRILCELPTAELRGVEHLLPSLTRGEGAWEAHFAGYRPVAADPLTRPRVGPDPLNRAHYLAEVARL